MSWRILLLLALSQRRRMLLLVPLLASLLILGALLDLQLCRPLEWGLSLPPRGRGLARPRAMRPLLLLLKSLV